MMSIDDWVKSVNGPDFVYGQLDSYDINPTPIGIGGFSKVFEVTKKSKKYAMKIPSDIEIDNDETMSLDRDSQNDFGKEARNWALISVKVPGDVIRLIDYNVDPFPWMVMELAEGSFKESIELNRATLDDFIQILHSLNNIHNAGIVHRDIKPENILNVNGKWKFSDFGLSKVMNSVSHSTVGIKGTPHYMAPEQVSKTKYGEIDTRTDIWQMGIMLYELLTHNLPYPSSDFAELCANIIGDGPDYEDAPADFIPILKKALAPQKDDRYATANDFANDISSIIMVQSELSDSKVKTEQNIYFDKNSADSEDNITALIRSAKKGDAKSQCELAYMYEIGDTIDMNMDKAIQWYTRAAENGSNVACFNLGIMYAQGRNVEKNLYKAEELLASAAKTMPEAKKALKSLERQLTKMEKKVKKKKR